MDNALLSDERRFDTLRDDEDYQAQQPGSGFGFGGNDLDYTDVDDDGSGGGIDDGLKTTPGKLVFYHL